MAGEYLNMKSKGTTVVALAVMFVMVSSCGLFKHCPSTHTETNVRDSVAIHWKDSTRIVDSLVVRDSVVLVPLPVESSQSVLPAMMPSHLETSLAESDAYVDSLGLHHTLKNKDTDIDVHVPVTEHHHYEEHTQQSDTTAHHSYSEKETVTEYVEKSLTKLQQFRHDAFWPLVCMLILNLVWIFRKSIFKF